MGEVSSLTRDARGRTGGPGGPPGPPDPAGPADRGPADQGSADQARADAGATPEEAARQICLRLLSHSPRTRAQLATALRRRGIPGQVADSILARFADVGLIDDAVFARAWVESRHHSRGLSRGLLAAELAQRGVDAADVRTAVASLLPDQEVSTARRLVVKRAAATRGRPLPSRVRQLVGLLARKGYPAGLAYRLVREVLEAEGADPAGAGLDLAALEDLDAPGTEPPWAEGPSPGGDTDP
jgi:regulatory protein